MMNYTIQWLFAVLLFYTGIADCQEAQKMQLSCAEIETLFLKNNLQLLAGQYNISIADAAIAQAKLWDNPNLSISGVNFWATSSQKEEIKELVASSFIPHTQFSIELSQLIQTANKRSKLVKVEKISKEIVQQEFEELLRGLKAELRKSVYEIQYSQSYLEILANQHQSISQLVESYKKQFQQGNIAKSELFRLQSSLLELDNEINETQMELAVQEQTLKIVLNIDPFTEIKITDSFSPKKNPDQIILSNLLQTANDFRPDMKQYRLQAQYFQRTLAYEKAQRVPDITVSANYDRYSGIWKNYIGFGVSMDLPIINRNQGNVKAAKWGMEQNQYLAQQQQNIVQHELSTAYNSYTFAYNFYKQIETDSLLPELDKMLDIYAKNLLNRNISMLEYVDFIETYRTSKQIMLAAEKKLYIQFEELQYTIGTDIR